MVVNTLSPVLVWAVAIKSLSRYFHDRPDLIELFEVLRLELSQHPNPDQLLELLAVDSLKDLAIKAVDSAAVYGSLPEVPPPLKNWHWFIGDRSPDV